MRYDQRAVDLGEIYGVAGDIAAGTAFGVAMIYAVFTYGLFLGLGFGWIPALVIAAAARYLWPLALLGLIVVFFYIIV